MTRKGRPVCESLVIFLLAHGFFVATLWRFRDKGILKQE